MRTKSWFVVPSLFVVSVGASGCLAESSWYTRGSDNEIVFAISQSKLADGKTVTRVGYEFLDIRDQGWTTYGYQTRDRSCWAEKLDTRLGQPRVEGGVAKFEGGSLPQGGIAVVANRPDELQLDAPAWSKGGETLTFEAQGFAMPSIERSRFTVPSVDLAITAPAADAEVALPADGELEVAWAPGDASTKDNVVASFFTEPADGTRGVELRCFFDREDGKGVFPKQLVARFAQLAGASNQGVEVKGKLRIATHRQLTIVARGGWIVYVVAGVEQREQPFVLKR